MILFSLLYRRYFPFQGEYTVARMGVQASQALRWKLAWPHASPTRPCQSYKVSGAEGACLMGSCPHLAFVASLQI